MDRIEEILIDITKDMKSHHDLECLQNEGIYVSEDTTVIHGPYISLVAGEWHIDVAGNAQDADARVDCVIGLGRIVLAEGSLTAGQCRLVVNAPRAIKGVEVRVHVRAGARVKIESIRLRRRIDRKYDRTFALYDRMGLKLLLDGSSLVDQATIENGQWDSEQIDFLLEFSLNLAPNCKKTFLDIGSYFGIYSLLMAKSCFFNEILAFEADKLNYKQLCANLLMNDPLNIVEPNFLAISDKPGFAVFASSISHPDGNRGGVGINGAGSVDAADNILVRKDTIDNLVPNAQGFFVAKIDVEGHELAVVRGMAATLQSSKALLQIECFSGLDQLDEMLKAYGHRRINRIGDDFYYTNI